MDQPVQKDVSVGETRGEEEGEGGGGGEGVIQMSRCSSAYDC